MRNLKQAWHNLCRSRDVLIILLYVPKRQAYLYTAMGWNPQCNNKPDWFLAQNEIYWAKQFLWCINVLSLFDKEDMWKGKLWQVKDEPAVNPMKGELEKRLSKLKTILWGSSGILLEMIEVAWICVCMLCRRKDKLVRSGLMLASSLSPLA